ncbi:NAD(P)-dependent oxidoreductase [Actinoalloteichus hymeniacidonis]|nr:NAD(P)-binding domain-containing protein [Actinoalloteichus hymeniacidonis]MBB5908330.1 3-hydroxyisobutyrate dehydrogenase-like beta-hydroxyacid dehydrogenase [Actinoalloteichus hymeniacidonis]
MNETSTITDHHVPVSVLGLGPMGRALAGALLAAGHPTTVWNRTTGRADELISRGAVAADSVTEAVQASPLVIVCVLDYDAVQEILAPAADAFDGRTLINLTADSPERARDMADWAAARGIAYLDGSIMTPTDTIGGASASVLYSGPIEVFTRWQDTLGHLGGSSHLGTDPGRAAAHDVALLGFFWSAMSGFVHALALAKAEGITATALAPYAKGIAGILPNIIDALAEEADAGDHPGEDSTIASVATSMDHIIHVSRNRGIDASVLTAARDIAVRAIEQGHGSEGFGRIADVLKRPTTS